MSVDLYKTAVRVVVEALAGIPDPTLDQVSELAPAAYRIVDALIAHGHLPVPVCGGCGVESGTQHQGGCTVARCKNCGWQYVGDHGQGCRPSERNATTIWTGSWPGDVEVEEFGLVDLNELYSLARQGFMRWSSEHERWYRR